MHCVSAHYLFASCAVSAHKLNNMGSPSQVLPWIESYSGGSIRDESLTLLY